MAIDAEEYATGHESRHRDCNIALVDYKGLRRFAVPQRNI